jgi:GT2 family glycosyltransferase
MLATISIACHNKLEYTQECVRHLIDTTPMEAVEVIFSDNCSTDGTKEYLESCSLPNKVIVTYGANFGYQVPHNEALKIAKGKFFIVLNNDIFIKNKDWLERLLKPLVDNPQIAISGFDGSPCSLKHDGCGFTGNTLEYIEGSCLAGKTELFKKHGLFSPSLKMFFFEDSDISLRYRQMGYEIVTVRCTFNHPRGKTVGSINRKLVEEVMNYNKIIFLKRWEPYLRNRKFFNQIKVRCSSAGIGDVIAMTPVIEGIRRDHPTAFFWLETNFPEVFENNPHINEIIPDGKPPIQSMDRDLDLMAPPSVGDRLNFAMKRLLCLLGEEKAGTKISSPYPQLFLTRKELDFGAKVVNQVRAGKRPIVGLSLLMNRTSWQGRNWKLNEAKKLVRALNRLGFATIEFGSNVPSTELATLDLIDKLSLREFFSIVANLTFRDKDKYGNDMKDLFIGIDSLGMHVAQAFKINSYFLFGATEPVARIVDFGFSTPIRNDGLNCLGCYQKKGDPNFNRCLLGTETCMDIPAELILSYIVGDIDGKTSNLHYLQSLIENR